MFMQRFLSCRASFGVNGTQWKCARVEASEGAEDWHVMAEPSLWRCSAETASPVWMPATWDRNTHWPGGGGVWKSSFQITTTESFVCVKPPACQIFR